MGTRPPRLPQASPVGVVASPSLLLPFCTAPPAPASQGGELEAGICIACFINLIMASGFCARQVYGCMTTTMCINSLNTTSTRNGWSVDYRHHNLFKVKLYSRSRLPTVKMSTESSRESHSTSNKRGRSCTEHDSCIAVNASKVLENDQVDKKGISETVSHVALKQWQTLQFMTAAGLVACILLVPSADAADALKTYACLLNECRLELVKCISNPSCAANIACLETCNGRPDESECEIKCGDLFENKVVDEFNQCVVSRKKCVPQKSDAGDFPIPDPSTVVKSFDISDFTGKWYITSGLNPTFDIFDCQEREFHVESEKLVGNLTWRIGTPDTGFFTRSAIQKFVQDPLQPGILYNHDNEYLHYQDDWYIISSKIENTRDDYVFVYYRGRNDGWDGYGGVVVYTRSAVLPKTIVPELERAAKSVGRDFSKFVTTDNTCGPERPLVERIKKTVDRWIWSTR